MASAHPSELLRITLATTRDAVIATDAEARVTQINPAAEMLTGWSEAEGLGRPLAELLDLFSESTRTPAQNAAFRVLRGEMVSGYNILIGRNGVARHIEGIATPMLDPDGAFIGSVLVLRDISGYEDADRLQARLAAIVESSDDAIVSKTLDGIIKSWNAGAQRVFGYTRDEAVGRPITMIIPEERYDEEREILARIARGERVEHFETIRVTKSGARIDISLTVSPVRDASGRIVGASKVARDIRERKRAEIALRDANVRKDQFIALLAHELRNPLAPLRNGLQVMRLAGHDAGAVAEARGMMERQLGHMVRLIDDLLDISRINQSKMDLRRSPVLLADIISNAVETARPTIDDARHALVISLPVEPVHLDADLTRLAQVFSNLLTNSAKYTTPGGNIWLTASRKGGKVTISVRDTGIGIPADAMPRIFDMFSQVDRSIERSSGGLGIGLALVKGLVEMHGGTVRAESEGIGKGTTFTVTLASHRTQADPTEPAEHAPVAAVVPKRILVADDNQDSAASMAMMLTLMGHEVSTAHDGAEAVQMAETVHPEVILMDLGMPKLNGYDATQRIREQPWGRDMMIIALTGWGHEADRLHSREAGCDGHLVKPVGAPELQALFAEFEKERIERTAGA